MIQSSDLYGAYGTLYQVLAKVPEDGVRHLAIVDVVARNLGEDVELDVRYLVGSNYSKSVNASYGSDAAWMWGGYSNCNCGPNTTYTNSCAHAQIQFRVNSAVAVSLAPGEYWTSVEIWSINQYGPDVPNYLYHWEDFVNSSNSSGKSNQDYLTYACVDSNCSTCLLTDDMSHHTQGTYDALMWIRSNHCPGKTPYAAVVGWDTGGGVYFHTCTFTYGVKTGSDG